MLPESRLATYSHLPSADGASATGRRSAGDSSAAGSPTANNALSGKISSNRRECRMVGCGRIKAAREFSLTDGPVGNKAKTTRFIAASAGWLLRFGQRAASEGRYDGRQSFV